LRKITVKIGLEGIDTQKEITVDVLLNSGATGLVMSSKFAKKQRFKLKKIDKPIYIRNMNGTFNKEEPIENTVKVSIYYQGHRERIEINVIGRQKWSIILGILWLAYYNLEIN